MDRLQRFLERSGWGRRLISVLVAVTTLAIVLTNLPPWELQRVTAPAVEPFVNATGLGQNWGVFSPDPRRISVELRARITYGDGSQVLWAPPDPGRWLGTYRSYRWRKWADRVRQDAYEGALWEPTARWLARTHSSGGREVASVTLIRRWSPIPPPGSDQQPGSWEEHGFFTLEAAGAEG